MSARCVTITPTWQVPNNIVAYTTTRLGGVSEGEYCGLNVGAHVGDNYKHVAQNRAAIPFSSKLIWLNQVHGKRVVTLPVTNQHNEKIDADAAISRSSSSFCAVMTADCVPVLVCNKAGTVVGAIHAGWKGLHADIIDSTILAMKETPANLYAWIGPAIGQQCYEVDASVAMRFEHVDYAVTTSSNPAKYLVDLPLIAEKQLRQCGVQNITQSHLCTYSDSERFYSHRYATHNGKSQTGRMVSVIGLR